MPTRTDCLATFAAVGLAAGALAEDQSWNAVNGGVFGVAANWGDGFNGAVPGFGDTAIFDLPSVYTVTLLESRVTDRLLVRSGIVTFDLGGALYTLLQFSPLDPGLVVGHGDGDLATVALGGGTLTASFASVGHESDAIGELEVGGADTNLLLAQQLWVGRLGVGFFDVNDGAEVANTAGELGLGGGAYAIGTVAGAGSAWICDGPLTIGNGGYGSLTVDDGAFVQCDDAIVAQQIGSQGDVTVSGPDTMWLIDGTLDVGMSGLATMAITDGAFVRNQVFATLGTLPTFPYQGGGRGDMLVAGADSRWLIDGDLYVGFRHLGSLTVLDSGTVTVTGDAYLGLPIQSGGGGYGELLIAGGLLMIDGGFTVSRAPSEPPDALRFEIGAVVGPLVEGGGPFTSNRDGLTASVTLGEGFAPSPGLHRRLLSASEGLEAIDAVALPPLPAEFFWAVRQTSTELTLIVLTESGCRAAPDGSDDCDANGTRDACDIAFALAPDCNENLVPDTCEIDRTLEFRSGYVSPFRVGDEVPIVVARAVDADGDVLIAATTRYGTVPIQETVAVEINGTPVGELFQVPFGGGAGTCGVSNDELVIPQETFNGLIVPGEEVIITLRLAADAEEVLCMRPTFVEAIVSYPVLGTNDRNHNGLVDDCEPPCEADFTGPIPGERDGNVDALDFLVLITEWGSPCAGGCLADITGPAEEPDGIVDALDILLLIAQWGSPADCSGS